MPAQPLTRLLPAARRPYLPPTLCGTVVHQIDNVLLPFKSKTVGAASLGAGPTTGGTVEAADIGSAVGGAVDTVTGAVGGLTSGAQAKLLPAPIADGDSVWDVLDAGNLTSLTGLIEVRAGRWAAGHARRRREVPQQLTTRPPPPVPTVAPAAAPPHPRAQLAGLADALSDPSFTGTVFAPTNDAILGALTAAAAAGITPSKELATKILVRRGWDCRGALGCRAGAGLPACLGARVLRHRAWPSRRLTRPRTLPSPAGPRAQRHPVLS